MMGAALRCGLLRMMAIMNSSSRKPSACRGISRAHEKVCCAAPAWGIAVLHLGCPELQVMNGRPLN